MDRSIDEMLTELLSRRRDQSLYELTVPHRAPGTPLSQGLDDRYSVRRRRTGGVQLGFAALDPREIRRGVRDPSRAL
jgi:hypothetical protein